MAASSDRTLPVPLRGTARETPFSVTSVSEGTLRLDLSGDLPPHWMANLAGGLSAAGLSILRGRAEQVDPLTWVSTFELLPVGDGPDPLALDYFSLASAEHRALIPDRITLAEHRLTSHRPDKPAHLEVRGPDQIGFLAFLLRSMAMFCIFPKAAVIDTVCGMASDSFTLGGVGRSIPSPKALEALRDVLSAQTFHAPQPVGELASPGRQG